MNVVVPPLRGFWSILCFDSVGLRPRLHDAAAARLKNISTTAVLALQFGPVASLATISILTAALGRILSSAGCQVAVN